MNLEGFFPFDQMRPEQRQVLRFIEKNQDKRYLLVDAPTGVGKSAIAISFMRGSGNSFLLTSTKMLQDQYASEFPDLVNLKGQGNYVCNINPAFRVDHAPCKVIEPQLRRCMQNDTCAYYTQRELALRSPHMLTSYAYFLSSVECGPLSKQQEWSSSKQHRRSVVVCDEAHELEQHLVEFSTSVLKPRELFEKYEVGIDPNMMFDLVGADREEQINRIYRAVLLRMEWLASKINEAIESAKDWAGGDPMKMSKFAAAQIRELSWQRDHLDRLYKRMSLYLVRDPHEQWIQKPTHNFERLQMTPLRPRKVFGQFMVPMGHRFLLMSASLGDPERVIDELDLPYDQVASIRVGTGFDPARSPIIPLQFARLGYREIDASIPNVLDAVAAILETHPNEKGIIHAGNYKLTKAILERSEPAVRARLIGKGESVGSSNEDLVRRHCESPEPTVLVSPSMYTGVDLRDDMSRFQVIVKLPWLNTTDPRAEAKLKEGGQWYSNMMWQKVIQASGRSTRSEEDHSKTYIIDAQFLDVYNRDQMTLPSWFKERIEWDK